MITYQKPDRIDLFGGGRTMWEFRQWLEERGYSTASWTAPRQHTADVPKVAWVVNDINDHTMPAVRDTTLGICFGPAWQFGTRIRSAYSNRLIDFMSIPYPSFLGGAHETWATLIGQKTWGCCLQLVTENTKQGECHDGGMICNAAFPYEERYSQYLDFLKGFIASVENGKTFHEGYVDRPWSFFPRLNTGANGWIDWSWSGQEIYRFINAFAPYGGAGTYLHGQEVRIIKATQWTSASSHSYCAGLVISVTGDGYKVACRDSHLVVQCGDMLKPGDRLHTDREKLEEALLYRPDYDAKGDTKMNGIPQSVNTVFVQADPIRIQLLKPDDVTQVYVDWLNDPEVNRYLEVRHQKWTRMKVGNWVHDQGANPDVALFGIYLYERHIGNIKIGPVNPHHHYADLSYFIGEKGLWSKGYATKAVKLAIGWAWKEMKLHRLQAGVYGTNLASVTVLVKCGFTQDGTFPQQLLLGGMWHNHLWYSITNPDWKP